MCYVNKTFITSKTFSIIMKLCYFKKNYIDEELYTSHEQYFPSLDEAKILKIIIIGI